MKKKIYTLLIAFSVSGLLFCGCGSGKSDSYVLGSTDYFGSNASYATAEYSPAEPSMATEGAYDSEYPFYDETTSGNSESGTPKTQDTSRKLIRTVNIDAETKEYEQALNTIENRVTALGGYMEELQSYTGSNYYYNSGAKSASMTIRIPAVNLDAFLDEVDGLCNVTRHNLSVSDVTLAYVDMESHVKALDVEYNRLLELLAEAETTYDILEIENRLTSIRYEKESYASQLRTYDNKVDYSTVYLSLQEVKELTIVEEEEPTVGERIKEGFSESFTDVCEGLIDFMVWFVTHIPQLIVWAVVITIFVMIWKLIRKWKSGKSDRKAAKEAKKAAKKAAKEASKEAAKEAANNSQMDRNSSDEL